MPERPTERRLRADLADDLDPGGVDAALDRDRPPLLVVQDRLEGEVTEQRLPRVGVDVAGRRSDLGVGVGREVLHQEVHEASVPLQDRQQLGGAVAGVWRRRWWWRCR